MNSSNQTLSMDLDVLINTYREPAWIINDQGSVLALNPLARRYHTSADTLDTLPKIEVLNQNRHRVGSPFKMNHHLLMQNPNYYLVLLEDFAQTVTTQDLVSPHTLSKPQEDFREEPQEESREDLFKQFIQLIPNPVFIKDRKHRWILFNRAFADFLGRTPDELMGKTDHDFFPEAEADIFWAKDEEVFLTGLLNENEESVTDAHGNTRWILTRKIALLNEQQDLILLGVITDISQQRLLTEKLDKARLDAELANHIKSKFLAQMSHELRTPLNAIIGFSQVLKNNSSHRNAAEENYLHRVHTNGVYLLSLINDLLDLSMIEAGQTDLHTETCNVSHLLTEIAELFCLRAEEKGLHFHLKTVPLVVETDTTRLRQIISNLLQNAVKFTEKGHVSLSLETQKNGYQVVVEDSGPGIPAHLQEPIFQEFVQVKEMQHASQGGVGLGLAISKRLSESLGFHLSLEEIPVGSRFVLWLGPQQS
jgi:two-component system, sensor histidine kinase and response regulator